MSLNKGGVCVAIFALLAALSTPVLASSASQAVVCDASDSAVDGTSTPEECPPPSTDEAQAVDPQADDAQSSADSSWATFEALDAQYQRKESMVINMLDVVGSNDGSTDHGAALAAVIAGMVAEANAQGATPTIYFPRGNWILSGNFANSEEKRFNIVGDGPLVTTIKRAKGATGDLFTLSAKNTFVEGFCIEGSRYQGATGDSVVLNGAYTSARHMLFTKSGGSGLVIGKAGVGIAHSLNDLQFRENAEYGIHVVAGSGSTDGMWTNIEIGNSGKYGVRLGTGAQNISNLHVWGSGLESDTERDGIFLESGSNILTGWQSEKNLGRGVRIQSNGNVLSGGRAWGNALGAVYMLSGQFNNITGNTFHQNSVNNTSGSTSTAFAVVLLEGLSTRNSISDNVFWDNTNDIGAASYVTAPKFPYPGRSGSARTHAILVAEGGTADFNVISGNMAQRELTRLGSATPPYVIVGNSDVISNNDWGVIQVPARSVASGAVRVPAESDTIIVAASQSITSVLGGKAGRVVQLIFTSSSPATVVDNGTTLNLNGDFKATKNDVLTLVSDGTNWYEVARSAN